MYVAINKTTDEVAVIKEKSSLARHIGMSVRNIYRKPDVNLWETDGFLIYKVTTLMLKSIRGGGKGNPQNLKKR